MADLASLYIKVDSKGVVTASKDLDNLTGKSKGAEKATKSVTKSFKEQIRIVKQLAAAYGAYKIAQYIKDTALLAARYETLGVVMHVVGRNAGYTAVQMDKFALGLQKTGIAMVESRNTLARMIQAQIDLTNSQKLARIAQDAAVIGAMNSSEAFEQMIYGLQTGHPRILRTIGLNVDFDKSVRALADSLGIKKDALSEAQIMQARVNAVVKAGVLITGTYEAAMTTAGKKIASFTRYVQDFKVKMGEAFGPATVILVDAATAAMKEMQDEISKPEAQEALRNLSTQLATTITQLGEDLPEAIEKTTAAIANIHAIYESLPDGVIGAAGAGLIGRILFGGWGPAKTIAALSLINTQMEKIKTSDIWGGEDIGWGLSAVIQNYREAVDALQKIEDEIAGRTIKGVPVEPLVKTFKITMPEVELPETIKPPPRGLSELQIKDMQMQEAFAIKMSAAEQERLNERYELEKEINAKIHDELLSDTEFRIQELDKQFLAADSFVKDKAMLDEWYVKKYEEIVGTQEQAYMDLYNNFGILTQEAYDQIYETYVKDRDDFIAMTGDKETAYQMFTERLNALNEEMEADNKSWIDGAKAGFESYVESSNDSFTNIKELAISSLQGMEDALVDFCMTGKLNFKQLAASVIRDLIRLAVQAAITNAIMAGLGAIGGGGGGATPSARSVAPASALTPTTGMGQSPQLMAKGGIFANGLSSHSNSIVDSPTFFSFARGQGLMGEAGPEAIMPLTRLPGGDLGVKTEQSESTVPTMTVNIHEAPGTQTQVEQSEDGQSLEVIIEQVEQSMQSRMSRGTGMAPFMDGRYGRAY